MSLKSFLEKTILKVGSNASLPQTATCVNLSNSIKSYTAPCDGYLMIDAQDSGTFYIDGGLLTLAQTASRFCAYVPLKKGVTAGLNCSTAGGSTVRFFATVRGGVSLLIQTLRNAGGGLCRLSLTSLHCSTRISRAASPTSRISLTRQARGLRSVVRTTLTQPTQRLLTDGLRLTRAPLVRFTTCTFTPTRGCESVSTTTKAKVGQLLMYLLAKAIQRTFILRTTERPHDSLLSSPRLATASFTTGGAL